MPKSDPCTTQTKAHKERNSMHNQHADLSQTLADQHRTQLRQRATHPRPLPVARERRRRSWSPRRWWQLLTRRPSRAS
jgi:hypothetical protein